MLGRLGNNAFVRNVATVFTGTAIAQALPLLVAPVLTRLYTPEQFGIFAIYLAIMTILATLATARYDVAITLPRIRAEAFGLFILSVALAGTICTVALIAAYFWKLPINRFLEAPPHGSTIFLVPLGAFTFALFRSASQWSIYNTQFRHLAAGKVAQAGGIAGIQLGAGFSALSNGLLIGQVLGLFLGSLYLFGRTIFGETQLFKTVNRQELKRIFVRYRRFPALSLPADLSNNLTTQLPFFVLGAFFGNVVVGYFLLTQRVLGAPIALLGVSIQEVFKERASRDYRETGSCRAIYLKTLITLTALALPPFIVLFIIAPPLFELIFGKQWLEAGHYARILIILFLVRFIASPLSYVLYIAEKQNVDLIWQVCLLVVTFCALIAGGLMGNPKLGIAFYAAGYTTMYLIYLMISYSYSSRAEHR